MHIGSRRVYPGELHSDFRICMRKIIKLSHVVALALIVLFCAAMKAACSEKQAPGQPKDPVYCVERVIDGDTLKVSGQGRVRLIGLDTPEVHYSDKLLRDAKRRKSDVGKIQELGRKASAFTKNLCLGKKVRLEFDVEKRDKYGRLLAYVYLEDGTFVNAKILEEGYGQVMTIPPNVRYADLFLQLQRQARNGRKGLWISGE
jgi:micrococcal nuclease